MKKQADHVIRLYLKEAKDLFVETDFDPLLKQSFLGSGMDYLVNRLRPTTLRKRLDVVLFLPKEKIESDLEKVIHEGIDRYCRFKIEENQYRLISLRWEGLKALQTGASFLALCLFISFFFKQATFLPDFASAVLSEGFLIAGWVAIWRPTEIFLYEWWPYWRDIRIYETIQKMDIVVKPDDRLA